MRLDDFIKVPAVDGPRKGSRSDTLTYFGPAWTSQSVDKLGKLHKWWWFAVYKCDVSPGLSYLGQGSGEASFS